MSYEKNTWQNGDIITQQKLNHMEDGIANVSAGGGVSVFMSDRDAKPYSGEIDAYFEGQPNGEKTTFNSDTSPLRFEDSLFNPYEYIFVDKLDIPFIDLERFPFANTLTYSTIIPEDFTVYNDYERTASLGVGNYLLKADKIIRCAWMENNELISKLFIVGNFEIISNSSLQ